MSTNLNIGYFKEKLEKELKEVEAELESVGRKNPDNPADWEAEPADFDTDKADESEVGDKIEEYEENSAVLKELEIKYNQIKKALTKIEDGSYGICEVSGEPIELERLEANPAATTCIKHMEK